MKTRGKFPAGFFVVACIICVWHFYVGSVTFFFMKNILWPQSATEAIALQKNLRQRVRVEDDFSSLEIIAGIDVSYDIKSNMSFAFVVLMRLEELKPFAQVMATLPTPFPYIPGLLSFREIPVILEAMQKLPTQPDMLMVDGQGIAHPRRLGIAAHLGVLVDMPAIGVAKSLLTGVYQEPGTAKGDHTWLMAGEEKIGTVLRSKERTKPLFISPGHRVSHASALEITLRCLTKYRLPEPTRIADKLSKIKSV